MLAVWLFTQCDGVLDKGHLTDRQFHPYDDGTKLGHELLITGKKTAF